VEPMIVVCNVEAPIGTQERMQRHRHPSRETEYVAPDRSTQCFNCSRIYFDQVLSRCPHCNSDSLQHYTTADLDRFAHSGAREPF
jgi:hypothetical protein